MQIGNGLPLSTLHTALPFIAPAVTAAVGGHITAISPCAGNTGEATQRVVTVRTNTNAEPLFIIVTDHH